MNDWFTTEEIDPDTFAISEYHHWEETHCYLVCGAKQALLIDTGLGVANIRQVVERLTMLPVTVVTTHAHWDHIGGHRHFDRIAVHAAERDWLAIQFPLSLQAVKKSLLAEPCDFPSDFSIDSYQLYQGEPQVILHDGDRIDLGDRSITVVHTPGHAPGHCCFYEPGRKYLYSGDLIYSGCLDAFYPTTDPQLFWQSLKRVRALEISSVLPGHHALHIPVSIVDQIETAFAGLDQAGLLRQGCGIFTYDGFQIHI